MSVLADQQAAAAEQFAVFGEVALGFPPLLLDGVPVDAITTDAEFDDMLTAGGLAEKGGYKASILISDHPEKPEEMTTVERRGEGPLYVLSVIKKLVTWEIVAGDPVAGE